MKKYRIFSTLLTMFLFTFPVVTCKWLLLDVDESPKVKSGLDPEKIFKEETEARSMDYQEIFENSLNVNDSLINNHVYVESETTIASNQNDNSESIKNSSNNDVEVQQKDILKMNLNFLPASDKAPNKSSVIDDNQIAWKDVDMDESIEQNSSISKEGNMKLENRSNFKQFWKFWDSRGRLKYAAKLRKLVRVGRDFGFLGISCSVTAKKRKCGGFEKSHSQRGNNRD